MDAFDEILSKLPSDIGGSTADNGFTFQKNWALKSKSPLARMAVPI